MISGENQRANQLRKEGRYKEALEIYSILWKNSKDPYIGAGYLHCLRKLNELEKSVKFAYELKDYQYNNNWVNNEILWTLIEELKTFEDYSKANELSNELLSLVSSQPNDLAIIVINNKMVKLAIDKENWKEGNHWLDKIRKDNLKDEIIGKSKWTMRTLWYYRKIRCLVEMGQYENSIILYEEIKDIHKPWEIQKQFLRIKAKALFEIGRLDESLQIYEKLSRGKVDWWILHEKATIMKNLGKKEEALGVLYIAANSFKQLDKLVTLFNDIGKLCLELNRNEEAVAHFILEKLVREENNWSIDSTLDSLINSYIISFPNYEQLVKVNDALVICRNFWEQSYINSNKIYSKSEKTPSTERDNRKIRIGLQGTVQRKSETNYFFIKTENESIICFQSVTTEEIQHGDDVIFDAHPSFDKKKKKKSWIAVNLRKSD